MPDLVAAMGELIGSGKARAWGIVNWQAEPFAEAVGAADLQGVPMPCAAQLPYSLVQRDWVESPEMTAALEASGAGVVASFVIAGGVLTGKYDAGATGRAVADLQTPRFAAARERGRALRALAAGAWPQPGGAGDRVRARQPRGRERAVRCHHAGTDRRERDRARGRSGRCAADLRALDARCGSTSSRVQPAPIPPRTWRWRTLCWNSSPRVTARR